MDEYKFNTGIFQYNVGAVLRNDHTGDTLTIEDRAITNYGNCGYTIRREGCEWTDWEGEYGLVKNWTLISDPISIEITTKRIQLIRQIKEMSDDEFLEVFNACEFV